MDREKAELIARSCTHFLSGHYRQPVRESLSELAGFADADLWADRYGQGEIISGFESEIAALLGKESAVFMPSGTMAQQIALRIWSDRKQIPHVAFHPTCHLELHEQKGYQLLHGLHALLVGSPDTLFTLEDLERVAEPLSTLLIELPQREIGGQLPAWDDLVAIAGWARNRGLALHMDGARLWECRPFYRRDYREIAGLFDSVYVSFYKTLGGITGAALAGPPDFIAEARIWQRRHGGNLMHLYPYVLSAKVGLAKRLSRMEQYRDRAVEIAGVLSAFEQIDCVPNPPQVNMMHLFLRGDRDRLEAAALDIAQTEKVWLFNRLVPTVVPDIQRFELSVGDASLDLPPEEIARLFGMLFDRAAGREE